jgi:tetratricopeptide (TPR) repeat protein
LVRAAAFDARTHRVHVLFGSCLSMSGMPLLPINDVLRAAYETDGGQWLKDALADCPRFVRDAVAPLVPEVGADGIDAASVSVAGADPWRQQHLFSALRALLAALGRTRTTALAVEDVHWADASTLDLLEYLIAPGHEIGVPVVLTFRSDDDDTPQKAAVWLARVRRSQALEILRLGALSRTETAEQIELLTGEAPPPSIVDAIYRRSEGNALFTEQLVGSGDPTQPPSGVLPDDLAELFDSKLRRLGPEAGMAARALAIAGRALVSQQLMDIAGVSSGDLAQALRELKSMRLIRTADADDLVALRHALLGEAVVADMLPVERVDLHRRCAIAFATGDRGRGVAAETAEHWRLAGAVEEELDWSVRAAREAETLHAAEQAASRWLRALELWDHATAPEVAAGMDLVEVYAAAEDALEYSGDSERAYELAKTALNRLAETASPAGKGDLYFRAGAYAGTTSPQQGLDLLDQAIELFDQLPPSVGLLRVLNMRASLLRGQGRHDEATQLIDQALRVSEELDVPAMRRRLLASRAWSDMEACDPDAARSRMSDAYPAQVGRSDPITELTLAIMHTDILLKTCAPTLDVEQAAAPGFRAIADFGLDEFHGTSILRSNVVDALIESGDIDRAADLLHPLEHVTASRDFRYTTLSRAELDILDGDLSSARRRFTDIEGLTATSISSRAEIVVRHAELELWAGDPHSAYRRTTELLRLAAPTRESKFMGASLVLAARAAADLADLGTGATKSTNVRVDGADLDGLRAAMIERPPGATARAGHRSSTPCRVAGRTHQVVPGAVGSIVGSSGLGVGPTGPTTPSRLLPVASNRSAAHPSRYPCPSRNRVTAGSRTSAAAHSTHNRHRRPRAAGPHRPQPTHHSDDRLNTQLDHAVRIDRPGIGRIAPTRRRPHQQPDRRDAVHQPQNRERSRHQHLAQTRRKHPRARRDRRRPTRTAELILGRDRSGRASRLLTDPMTMRQSTALDAGRSRRQPTSSKRTRPSINDARPTEIDSSRAPNRDVHDVSAECPGGGDMWAVSGSGPDDDASNAGASHWPRVQTRRA